jgi:murein DD-endopeptidase MepM/ murein hydrolase activator NlpD
MAKKHTVFLVPPGGSKGHALRIRPGFIILICIVLVTGLAGYFIPFQIFTKDVVEKNQQKNLAEQNKSLLERILATFKTVNILRTQITSLETQRSAIASALKPRPAENAPEKEKPRQAAASLGLDQLLAVVNASERYYRALIADSSVRASQFDTLPVLRPVKGEALVTAGFGKQRDLFTGLEKWHYGMDFAAQQETPVIATASGVAETIEEDRQWGKRVVIRHCATYSTVYSHLGTITIAHGARVKRGDGIATVGISGLTRGPHLHYEIYKNNTPVNPADFYFPDSLLSDPVETAQK